MHPHLVFWISAIVRMIVVLLTAAVGWFCWGAVPGLLLGLAGMMGLICIQLFYLLRLSDWLDNPNTVRLPDGWGAWTDVFSRLYRLRRGDEKTRPNWQSGWRAFARP